MKRCLMNQTITLKDSIVHDDSRSIISADEDMGKMKFIVYITAALLTGMVLMLFAKGCDREPMPKPGHAQAECGSCHAQTRHSRMTEYFRKAKHPSDPAKLATAVLMTPYPKTLAAIAVAEHSPVTSTHGGRGKRHVGVFQMSKSNARAYGKTPKDIDGQARQAARLLTDLLAEEKTLPLAVAKYGGEINTDKYSRFVMAEIQRVP